jgi:CRP-like cAMP-binding protein
MEHLFKEKSMLNLPLGKTIDSPISFKAGTVLFSQGEASKYLFILKKGEVRLLKTVGQHLSVLKICKEREILNEVSVLTNGPVEFSAIAKTDIELVLFNQKEILAVINQGPSWIPEIFETLCDRLKATMEIIEEHNLSAGEKSPDSLLNKEDEKKYLAALADYNLS